MSRNHWAILSGASDQTQVLTCVRSLYYLNHITNPLHKHPLKILLNQSKIFFFETTPVHTHTQTHTHMRVLTESFIIVFLLIIQGFSYTKYNP